MDIRWKLSGMPNSNCFDFCQNFKKWENFWFFPNELQIETIYFTLALSFSSFLSVFLFNDKLSMFTRLLNYGNLLIFMKNFLIFYVVYWEVSIFWYFFSNFFSFIGAFESFLNNFLIETIHFHLLRSFIFFSIFLKIFKFIFCQFLFNFFHMYLIFYFNFL